MSADFYGLVLSWLRCQEGSWDSQYTAEASQVTAVTGDGTDWAGDTEGGFYETFSVTIQYVTKDGAVRTYEASGEAMASLWRAVFGAFRRQTTG